MPHKLVDEAIVIAIGPLIDDTDFKTLEVAIAHNEAGMSIDLFQESETALTKTDIVPTGGAGANDWTHKGNGVYELEITAAQNDTEGTLFAVGVCDGVLPFGSVHYEIGTGCVNELADLEDVGDTTPTGGQVLRADGDSWESIKLAGTDVAFTPGDADDWNAGDPGDIDDALDELAGNMQPLLPPAAPVLDDVSFTSGDGAAGKNTWNAANPIGGYTTAAAAGSVNNAGDDVDITMGTSGNEHGVYDFDTIVSVEGILNDDVTATDNYPADCFGPGGSDGGGTNDLKLLVNGAIIHTVDLLVAGAGSDVNGNGSGFIDLSAATPVTFDDGETEFPPRKYRTGTWKVFAADMDKGYNVIKVQHVTTAGTENTNVEEFLLDDDDTATGFAAFSIAGYPGAATTKDLSGVTYHNGTVTGTYACTVNNAYRNTFRTGTAITHPTTTNCSCAGESLAASAGDEAKAVAVSQTATIDVTRVTGANMVVNTQADRTVQADDSGGSASVTELLVDLDTQANAALAHYYADEGYRLESTQNFNNNLVSAWDESKTLVDAGDNGYKDAAQVTEDKVIYPGEGTVADYGGLANAPGGNPDYSVGVSGVRYYYGYLTSATGRSNFAFNIQGSATLVDDGDVVTDTDKVSIAIRLPTQTGWMCINQDYSPGQWGSTGESSTYVADVGCFAETYGADKMIPTSALGFSVGSKTTDDSFDKIYYRITVPQGWTGNIASITITWGA